MKTMKHNKWWVLLLSMAFAIMGMACSSDEVAEEEKTEILEEKVEETTDEPNDENKEDASKENHSDYYGEHTYIPEIGRLIIKLNMADNRFEDLKTIGHLKDVLYDRDKTKKSSYIPMTDTLGMILRNDTIFFLHNDSVFYPTRLPDDFKKRYEVCAVYTLSGIVKEKPREDVDFYPLIMEKIHLDYFINH